MYKLSLKKKMYLQVVGICLLLASISGYIIYQNKKNSQLFLTIAQESMPKIEKLGSLLAKFRDIRIQVRSVGLAGNTTEDYQRFEKETVRAIEEFLEEKKQLTAMNLSAEEKKHLGELDKAWADFYDFGKGLLGLLRKGDADSMSLLNDQVRNVCQVKADVFVKELEEFIQREKAFSEALVKEAISREASTGVVALVTLLAGLGLSLLVGGYYANSVSRSLETNIKVLSEGSQEIDEFSEQISKVSSTLSEGSLQQASSLQQTVTAIDEISAMVARNADNAGASAKNSEKSIEAVERGKEKVEEMVSSITAISQSNNEIVTQMQQTNQEISEIVTVIQDIATKTQVINDIVFQTKLLSFNASVEAARAGENGKGFAVVAEEVGNLASMSGAAASEISALLKSSTDKVTEVVSKTQKLMDRAIYESKAKVDDGIERAHECSYALDEILKNVQTVNSMVKEISSASHDQSMGVREVNKSMLEFDRVTQMNTSSALETSKTADVLKTQAQKLTLLVGSLTEIVEGKKSA